MVGAVRKKRSFTVDLTSEKVGKFVKRESCVSIRVNSANDRKHFLLDKVGAKLAEKGLQIVCADMSLIVAINSPVCALNTVICAARKIVTQTFNSLHEVDFLFDHCDQLTFLIVGKTVETAHSRVGSSLHRTAQLHVIARQH